MRAVPLLMLAFACQMLSAQEQLLPVLHFDHLTTDNGLPTNEIPANVVRDGQGYVWIGTKDGLVRYDGHSCEVYRNDSPRPGRLASSHIMALHADRRGFLWFGTMKSGLGIFDPTSCRFINLLSRTPAKSKPLPESVVIIHEDATGNLWCGSMSGAVVYVDLSAVPLEINPDSLESCLRYRTIQGFKNTVWDFANWNGDTVLAASDNGLFLIDRVTGTPSRPGIPPTPEIRLDTARVTSLCWENSDRLWLGSYSHGLHLYDRGKRVLTTYHKRHARASQVRDDHITFARFDRTGRFWVGTRSGVDLFDPSSGVYGDYLKPIGSQFGEVTFLYPDREGILWVSTAANGVYLLPPRSFRLPHYGLRQSGSAPAAMESISQLADGTLWIRSEGRALQLEPHTLAVLRTVDLYKGAKPTYSGWGSSHADSRGRIWYATFGLGIYQLDPASGMVRNFRPSAQLPGLPFKMDACVGITGNGSDSLWVAGYKDGLLQFDMRTNRFVDRSGIFDGRPANVLDVACDDRGNLWVSDQVFGLYRIDPGTLSVKRFGSDTLRSNEFIDDELQGVFRDPRNDIWVSARTLSLWEQEHGGFRSFPNDRFRDARFAAARLRDRRGRLWVWYPGAGLGILDPATGAYANYDFSDGFAGGTDMAELQDGRVAMVGPYGMNIVEPDSLTGPLEAPPLVITRITVNDTIQLSPLSIDPDGIRLPHHQGVVEFEFAAIDPGGGHQVEYLYRLEGLETEWVRARPQRYVRYPGLGPGDYIFNVRAANALGRWPEQKLALAVVIDPPPWRTAWAYGAYAAVVLALLFGALRLRQHQERLKRQAEMDRFQAQQLEEMDRVKSRFFANISHEFRTPLTLILGPARQLLQEGSDEPTKTKADLIHRSASKLNRLVDELLDLSRIEAGAMKLAARPVDVVSTVRNMVLTFQPLAERKGISCTFSGGEDGIAAYLDPEKIDTILSNVLSNAFKFTPEGGRVDVGIANRRREEIDYVEIAISDTGIGIPEEKIAKVFDRFYQVDGSHTREQEGTGIGLSLTNELVRLHHGKIEVESQEGRGSTFRLLFPLGKEHLRPDELGGEGQELPGSRIDLPVDEAAGEAHNRKMNADDSEPPSVPTVLIVEDNADVRMYVRQILEERYSIIEARDGQEGLDRALECTPDLIVSDIMMPKMDGFQLCARWKSDTRTSHIPVIMLTAKATMKDKIAGLEAGADDYIMKPFEADELRARITNLIGQRKRLHEHYRTYGLVGMEAEKITPADQKFLRKAADVVTEHLADPSFSVQAFAEQMAVSRSLLCRKLDALIGESPNELLRRIRLKKAAQLLEAKAGNVSEIALEVGFNSPSYFAECFRKQYGCTPTQYHQNRQTSTPDPDGMS